MIGLDNDEHIIFQIRKHWLALGFRLLGVLAVAILPLFVMLALKGLQINIILVSGSMTALVIFLYSILLLLLWIITFIFWTDYYLDIWIITDHKLVDIEQRGLFTRQISILHLDKIQDITSDVHGILATFVNYGDLHVQTAGQKREFIIHRVSNPDELRQRINDALVRYKEDYLPAKGRINNSV